MQIFYIHAEAYITPQNPKEDVRRTDISVAYSYESGDLLFNLAVRAEVDVNRRNIARSISSGRLGKAPLRIKDWVGRRMLDVNEMSGRDINRMILEDIENELNTSELLYWHEINNKYLNAIEYLEFVPLYT